MTHAKTPIPPTQSPTQKPPVDGLQLTGLIWTRVAMTHMTHTSTCGHMTHMTHGRSSMQSACNPVGVAHMTHGPHHWRHVAVQHTCLGNGCLGNGCLGNGCLGMHRPADGGEGRPPAGHAGEGSANKIFLAHKS